MTPALRVLWDGVGAVILHSACLSGSKSTLGWCSGFAAFVTPAVKVLWDSSVGCSGILHWWEQGSEGVSGIGRGWRALRGSWIWALREERIVASRRCGERGE